MSVYLHIINSYPQNYIYYSINQDYNGNQKGLIKLKKVICLLAIIAVAFGGYYIKGQYFYNGREYVGEWETSKTHLTIARQDDHFILKYNNNDIFIARLTDEQELQSDIDKENKLTYLPKDNAIHFNNSYYTRVNGEIITKPPQAITLNSGF